MPSPPRLPLLFACRRRRPCRIGGVAGRPAGRRRARHPADRQHRQVRDRRHQGRRRRQGRRSARAMTAGAGPSAGLAGAVGQDQQPAAHRGARTCPIRCSTDWSRRSSSSRSRSARTATSPTLGVLFDRARAGEMLGVAGAVRRSAPMLVIPVMITGGAATSFEFRNAWQRAWAQFRTAQQPDRLCPGQRHWASTRCSQRGPDAAARAAAGGG